MQKKKRLPAIEYIRGISMLGVVGIHVGSQYLMNPMANVHLVALFEIATRFSVPIFFFISAFGLFYHLDPGAPFSYTDFLRRRFRTVLVPYLAWSFFYILHYTVLYRDTMLLSLRQIAKYLFFGFASYQLYFMVILLWFYLLMPLWIAVVRRMTLSRLAALLALQIAFNYYISSLLDASAIANPYLRYLVENRLNYWPFPYVFIFVLGGWLALRSNEFLRFLRRRYASLSLFFFGSLAALLAYYYWCLFVRGYTPVGGVNTAHQLCPPGVVYTLAASLFFFAVFTEQRYPKGLNTIFSFLGRHSYFVYLAHPVVITYLGILVEKLGLIMTAPLAILFYLATVLLALALAVSVRRLGDRHPVINRLTIGI